MHKQIDTWLDLIVLILLALMAATVAVTSATSLVLDIAQDKVLVDIGRPNYDEVSYTVQDVLLTIVRFDTGYPIHRLKVFYEGKETELDPSKTNDKEAMCKALMGLREAGVSSTDFYSYPVEFERYLDKDNNNLIYNITIKKPEVT